MKEHFKNIICFKIKANFIKIIILCVVLILSYIFMSNNNWIYKDTIVKITDIDIKSENTFEGANGENEKLYTQDIKAEIKNGNYKGKTVSFTNTYSYSSVNTNKYRKGNELFVNIKDIDGTLTIKVNDVKRDTYLIMLLMLFICIVLIACGKRAIYTLISIAVNTVMLVVAIGVFPTSAFVGWIWIVLLLLFTVVTVFLASGFHKKSIGAFLSTLCTVLLIAALYTITVYRNTSLPYETMDYVLAFLPIKKIYLTSIIIGCLGAITDVSVTINSSVHELVKVGNGSMTLKQLIDSTRKIGQDIMGTMMNVLLFSYVSGSIPMIVLKLANGIGLNIVFISDYIFELVRFLTGSIGIVAAIPISGFIAVLLCRKELLKG